LSVRPSSQKEEKHIELILAFSTTFHFDTFAEQMGKKKAVAERF
jgi:hypothetical protein